MNTILEGAFVGEEDEGYLFELETGDEALVDPGEYEDAPDWEEGDEMPLLVGKPVGKRWNASARKVDKLELWDDLERAAEEGETVEGEIIAENKGGLTVDIGVRAFLPRSHVELYRIDDTADYIGESGEFEVMQFDGDRCNVVVSRRKVLERQRENRREETLEALEEGKTFEGIVRNLKHYGAFVDIGGVDGLLHISNISWRRIDHPGDVLDSGQKVEVVVLDVDREEEKVSLGRKQLLDDPWEQFESEYEEGDVASGEVVNLEDFGAFVELQEGVQGLVHVTELSWVDNASHPGQIVSVGQEVDVEITEIDTDERRIGLSMKQLRPNPWAEIDEQAEVGDVVEGEITSITDFGMFVEVIEDVEGLVHISDISWTEQIQDVSNHYEEGETVEAKVLEIDPEAQRLGLGVKQLSDDPWTKAEEKAEPGEKIDVEVTKLTDFGAFAEVVEGVEGLIHISELSERRIDSPEEVVRPGEELEVLVLDFDRENERIGLSLIKDELESGEANEYVDDEDEGAVSLGDVIGEQLKAAGAEGESADDEDEADGTDS
ncbi:MAG: 30S ribosomal protein S1 [Bradymonadaceae bacterium]